MEQLFDPLPHPERTAVHGDRRPKTDGPLSTSFTRMQTVRSRRQTILND